MIKDKTKLDDICEKVLSDAMDFYDIPGVAIGVSIGDDYEFTGARGYKNYFTKDPLKPEHIFHCASVSKVFTAMGIMKLIEKGTLNLNDRLVEYLPFLKEIDERYEAVEIRHMLSHISGLGDILDYHWDEPAVHDEALMDFATSDEVKGEKMLWEAGKGDFMYSNMAYEFMGLIISQMTGKTYEESMKEMLLEPAGMKESTFFTPERTGGALDLETIDKTNMAMPHGKAEDRSMIFEPDYPYNRMHAPSSTLTSNVGDLLKWGRANIKRQMLKSETYDMVWEKYATVPNNGEGMGLGWFMREQNGYKLVGHEGTDDGFRASFWICKELEIAIVVLCNLTQSPVKKLNKQIFEAIVNA